jgi:hypothetical protein
MSKPNALGQRHKTWESVVAHGPSAWACHVAMAIRSLIWSLLHAGRFESLLEALMETVARFWWVSDIFDGVAASGWHVPGFLACSSLL